MAKTRFAMVTAIAILATVAISVLASIGNAGKSESEAFLQRALAAQHENDHGLTVGSTGTGTVTMFNGDVHHRHTETVRSHTGDFRWLEWYEGCTYPYKPDANLCSAETVIHDDTRYERIVTSNGPGEWRVMDDCGYLCGTKFESVEFGIVSETIYKVGDVVELERETIDGVEYRRLQTTRRPLERALQLTESGELEPPGDLSQEDYSEMLTLSANQLITYVYWIREDNGEIWRVKRQWVNTNTDVSETARAIIPHRSLDVEEHSRHSVPVEIRPPIE